MNQTTASPIRKPQRFSIPPRRPLKQRVYPSVRPNGMSIAIGVPCSDGIVLACDHQYTIGFTKIVGKKMFAGFRYYEPHSYNSVLIVATDNPESGKKLSDLIIKSLPDRFTQDEFVTSAESTLRHYLDKYVFDLPQKEQESLYCDFLVAVRCGVECSLYRSNGSMLVLQDMPVCIGEGLYLGNYLISRLLSPVRRSTEVVAQIVAHIISASAEYINSIGKGTSIHVLSVNGVHSSILLPERKLIEVHIEEAFRSFSEALACRDVEATDERLLDFHVEYVRKAILALRECHSQRIERRSKMAKSIAEAETQCPPRPTDAPSLPPPLSESSEGSHES